MVGLSLGLLRKSNYINGRWVKRGKGFPVFNPATGEEIAKIARAGKVDVEAAIEAASTAFNVWRKRVAAERSALIRYWADLMMAHRQDLAMLMTAEHGKPFREATAEVIYAADYLVWFAEEARRVYGDIIPAHKENARILVTKEPVGVVAAITPWNFPLAMLTRKAGAALASGCTMIARPSDETPLSALALAALAEKAGIPPGVFNVISGPSFVVADVLMKSKTVRKLSFTGSTEIGKLLMRESADTLKRVSLELGGNAPFIIFEDADIDSAVQGAIACKFRNSGQTCVSANRFLVHDSVYDVFTQKLTEAAGALKVGNGMDNGTEQGPLINRAALEKVELLVANARAQGGKVLCGGKVHALGGTFYEPTVIAEASLKMDMAHEEIFGPVAACFRFHDEAEAIALANATDSGLASYFYTRDMARAWRVADALEAGIVGINEGVISTVQSPFGGIKESGMGREGSKYGIQDYMSTKYILMGGL